MSNKEEVGKKRSKNSSNSSKSDADEDYRAHLSDAEEIPTKVTGLKYGEQLTDDLLNSFSDKVQQAAGDDVEGFMAIQAIQLMPEVIPTIISGKKRVLQILLDSYRKHYILIEWDPKFKERGAVIWDPLIVTAKDFHHTLNNSFKHQFLRLFDHIYVSADANNNNDDDIIPCKLETFAYGQYDNWSCGLRAAALLVLRAFNGHEILHGGDINIKVKKFHEILKLIVELDRKATKEDFQIDYWFQKTSYTYEFAFVTMNKSDLKVYCMYQNSRRKEKNYVKDDQDDDISKLKKEIENFSLKSKAKNENRSSTTDDDEEEEDESHIDTESSTNEPSQELNDTKDTIKDDEEDILKSEKSEKENVKSEKSEKEKTPQKSSPSTSSTSTTTTDDPN
uniref:OTU domain-containing protein n=1 Tax=Panagrolaimus sp. ES5 TaxID=591445 RepID=A0AC34FIW0_9BILA